MQHISHMSLYKKVSIISITTMCSVSIRIKTEEGKQGEPVVRADNSARQQLAIVISKQCHCKSFLWVPPRELQTSRQLMYFPPKIWQELKPTKPNTSVQRTTVLSKYYAEKSLGSLTHEYVPSLQVLQQVS